MPPGWVMAGKCAGREGVEGEKSEMKIKGVKVTTSQRPFFRIPKRNKLLLLCNVVLQPQLLPSPFALANRDLFGHKARCLALGFVC